MVRIDPVRPNARPGRAVSVYGGARTEGPTHGSVARR
jgi:hypothetical protein